jgi:sortase A
MKLNRINTVLLVLIVLVNTYTIAVPFAPALLFKLQNHNGTRQKLTEQLHPSSDTTTANPVVVMTQPNHVVIPSMLLDQPVLDGPASQQYKILDEGIWRYDKGSTPDKGGNTVLVGHRFTYTKPKGVFYYLNKVAVGDEIGVFWSNKKYLYRVSSVNVVAPTDTAIENNSTQSELTLFTCTPLWLPKDRMVVVASLESSS